MTRTHSDRRTTKSRIDNVARGYGRRAFSIAHQQSIRGTRNHATDNRCAAYGHRNAQSRYLRPMQLTSSADSVHRTGRGEH